MSDYFETRERALLGARFEMLHTPKTATPARGVTVNGLRCTPEEFAAKAGLALKPSPFCKNAFLLEERAVSGFKPGLHPYHHAGAFYSQEPSASAPAPLLDVRPGMRVLDLCAAPGGKSSQLAAALLGVGVLVANEPEPPRAEVLRQNLERMGVKNAVVTCETPARLAAALPGWFDRVLVDAPCSGEGMFRKESAALSQHSAALVARCAALGREILDAAAVLLAPGGVLVYSTCTFAPEEDEGQVAAFLTRHPEFALEDLSNVGFGSPGEQNRAGGILAEASFCRRIWPSQGGEGHFMARLRKKAAALASIQDRPRRAKPSRRGAPGKKGASPEAVWKAFAGEYFPALADAPCMALGEWVLLPPPEAGPVLEAGAHLLRAGILAGSVKAGRFTPAHALFMACGAQCQNAERLTMDDPRTAAWLRGEEVAALSAQNGWCALLLDGLPLGGGKTSGGRVKNHYPKALRNLK